MSNPAAVVAAVESRSADQIALIVNDRHDIHHVNERGYVESPGTGEKHFSCHRTQRPVRHHQTTAFSGQAPARGSRCGFRELSQTGLRRGTRREIPVSLYFSHSQQDPGPPKEPSVLSGYYCIDTFTPINANAYLAARRSVDCALTAAREILDGRRMAYALIRPPGHHAERRSFGGFCYFNNNAIAAQYLCAHGKVAILDVDYHHGNGGQDIFYRRSDVLTVSIHGHPKFAYPYFCGFEEERGDGDGEGFNLNVPLPEAVDGEKYRKALARALRRIEEFQPQFLVIALGLDPAKGDPTGTWSLTVKDFTENGRMIGSLGLPVVVIQEGGYRTQTLGKNALAFFRGLVEGAGQWADSRHLPIHRVHGVTFRDTIVPEDGPRVRRLVDITGFFHPEEVAVAEELVLERLEKGDASGYYFSMADHYGRLAGYACFGPIPCTASSYDLYWIAVHPDFQGRGLGRRLLVESERRIKAAGGSRIYVDTSQRVQYASTRTFYESCGYRLETVLKDFYAVGDGKAIYCKSLI